MDPAEEKAQNEKKRNFVIKEIISTERTYLSRLQIAIDLYAHPLKNNRILGNAEFEAQFSSLEKLYELHNKFYVSDEQADNLDFVALLDDITEKFQIYSDYLVNYEPAMQKRGSLLTSNRKYSDFLEKVMKDPACQNMTIESLLIMPVQRIPRYRLLLEQLLKFTDETHPQYASVKRALDMICDMAHFNNEAIRARENKTKTMSVMMTIEPRTRIDLLDDSTRQFIKEGDLQRQCRRGLKEFHFWLFSDKLLYGQKLPLVGENYMLNREIPLSKCFVKLFDTIYDRNVTLMVQSPAKSFVVRLGTQSERDDWLKAIQDAIQKLRENGLARGGTVAPLWTPDATSTECQKCQGKFNLINRRHHCRHCGEMVCDSCSSKRYLLKDVNEKKEVRVCDTCHTELTSSSSAKHGDNDLYNSDEDDESGGGRGSVNEDDLNDFNEEYDDLGNKIISSPQTPKTPNSVGFKDLSSSSSESNVRKPRKSLFAFAEEQLSKLGLKSSESSGKSTSSGGGSERPGLSRGKSTGDISPRKDSGDRPNSVNNPAFYDASIVRFNEPPKDSNSPPPVKPPKPIVKRRTNILRPEEMPKDFGQHDD